jgi:hypothetical protein
VSGDSVMLERAIFMSSPFQNMNLLKSVTLPDPGNGSVVAALVLVSGMASMILT